MDVRQTITQLYRDYENRDLKKIWLHAGRLCVRGPATRSRTSTPASVTARTSWSASDGYWNELSIQRLSRNSILVDGDRAQRSCRST
jgi:hypothetical protein